MTSGTAARIGRIQRITRRWQTDTTRQRVRETRHASSASSANSVQSASPPFVIVASIPRSLSCSTGDSQATMTREHQRGLGGFNGFGGDGRRIQPGKEYEKRVTPRPRHPPNPFNPRFYLSSSWPASRGLLLFDRRQPGHDRQLRSIRVSTFRHRGQHPIRSLEVKRCRYRSLR
jgi:hypothetical protein